MFSGKLMKYFTNPVACKLFYDIETHGQTTAKDIGSRNKEIPQATLYRYLNKMVNDGLLTVVDEKQIRNVKEKTYAVSIDYKAEIAKMISENSGEGYLGLFRQFCNGLINEFQTYVETDSIDILNDGSGFRVTPFYATTDELKELAEKIKETIKPYHENKPSPNRQMRNVAIIFTPPTDK